MKKMFLIKSAVLLVLAAMVVVGCGKSPEELKAQLKELENNSSEAYSVDGDTERALTLAQEALQLAQQMQKKGLLDAVEVEALESNVKSYTAEIARDKTMSPAEKKLVAEYKKPAEVAPESDFEVKLNNDGDGALITKYTGPGGNIIIPATIQGFPVLAVDMNPPRNSKGENATLHSVVIPEGIQWVCGFRGCVALRSVTLPDSVAWIENGAFNCCYSLTSINIPTGVKWIGNSAFGDCNSLTSVTIPGSVTEIGNNDRYGSGGAFMNCTRLATVTILNGVTSISGYAFSGCTSLASITIPDSVTLIGAEAFSGCTSLTSITIPDSVTDIGYTPARFTSGETFSGCNSLVTVSISPVKRKMGSSIFSNCPKLSLASQAAIKAAEAAAKN